MPAAVWQAQDTSGLTNARCGSRDAAAKISKTKSVGWRLDERRPAFLQVRGHLDLAGVGPEFERNPCAKNRREDWARRIYFVVSERLRAALPIETGEVRCGDLLVAINGGAVDAWPLDAVCDALRSAPRPVTLVFERGRGALAQGICTFDDILRDPRKTPFFSAVSAKTIATRE